MAETKKTVKEVETKVKETAKKVADKVPVKETAKKVAEKVPVKETAQKVAETGKETAKKVAEKVTVKKAAVRKKTAAKKPVKTEVFLQYSGKEVVYTDLVKKAAQLSKKALKTQAKEIKVYIKPEENMAYYVANGGEDIGSFPI